jgi:hypothetical protein
MNLPEALRGLSRGCAFEVADHEAVSFVRNVLLDPERSVPVVGVTTHPIYGRCLVDFERLARDLRGVALVVVVPTGPATFTLADELSDDLAAYGGFVRIWMPGLHPASSGHHHPLFPLVSDRAGAQALRTIVLAARHALRLVARRRQSTSDSDSRMLVGAPARVAVPWNTDAGDSGSLGWWHCDC